MEVFKISDVWTDWEVMAEGQILGISMTSRSSRYVYSPFTIIKMPDKIINLVGDLETQIVQLMISNVILYSHKPGPYGMTYGRIRIIPSKTYHAENPKQKREDPDLPVIELNKLELGTGSEKEEKTTE